MQAKSLILRWSGFFEQDLAGAVFDGSDLSFVTFKDCDLTGVSFRNACLANATFDGCFGWREPEVPTFYTVDFTNADITGIGLESFVRMSPGQFMSTRSYKNRKLQGCWLNVSRFGYDDSPPAYDFRGGDLTEARLDGDFSQADFSDATIDRMRFSVGSVRFGQLVESRNFRLGQMRGMRLEFDGETCDFSGTNLTGSRITVRNGRVSLAGAVITGVSFRDVDVGKQIPRTANYALGEFSGVGFGISDLGGVDLKRQILTRCDFSRCNLAGTTFDDSVISGSVFADRPDGQPGVTVEQIKSTWNYKNGRMDGIILPKAVADALAREAAKHEGEQ